MKISKSKQELASIISENGGWRDGEFAAQDGDGGVGGYEVKPEWDSLAKHWWRESSGQWFLENKIKNHHQTVLSRAEYFLLRPAPDADGWIEHDGKHEPAVATSGLTLWCRWSDGLEQSHEANMVDWIDDSDVRIIAYRLHKPEIATSAREPKPVPVPEAKPTIEQLAQDYRNAKGHADRLQKEAGEAAVKAESLAVEIRKKILELQELIGISKSDPETELEITDWLDLQAGDVISVSGEWWEPDSEYTVNENDGSRDAPIMVGGYWAPIGECSFKFIRRP